MSPTDNTRHKEERSALCVVSSDASFFYVKYVKNKKQRRIFQWIKKNKKNQTKTGWLCFGYRHKDAIYTFVLFSFEVTVISSCISIRRADKKHLATLAILLREQTFLPKDTWKRSPRRMGFEPLTLHSGGRTTSTRKSGGKQNQTNARKEQRMPEYISRALVVVVLRFSLTEFKRQSSDIFKFKC